MTTSQRIVRKSLAGEEDILFGEDTQTQTRNGVDYTITKVRNIRPVNSLAELNALDTTRFVKAALFDSTLDNVEFYSYNAGSGLWEKAKNNFADIVRPMTVAEFKASTELYDGMKIELTDRAGARFTVSTGIVGANEFNVIANTTSTFKATLEQTSRIFPEHYGYVGNGVANDTAVLEAVASYVDSIGGYCSVEFPENSIALVSYTGGYSSVFGHVVMDFVSLSNVTIKGNGTTVKCVNHNIAANGGLRFINFDGCPKHKVDGFYFDMTFTGYNTSASYYPFCGAITAYQTANGSYTQSQISSDVRYSNLRFKLYHEKGCYMRSANPYLGDDNNGFKIYSVFCYGDYLATAYANQQRGCAFRNITFEDGHNGYGLWAWAYNDVVFDGIRGNNFVTKYSNSSGAVGGGGVPMIRYHQWHCSGVFVDNIYFKAKPCSQRTIVGFEGEGRMMNLGTNLNGDYSHGHTVIGDNITCILGKGDATNSITDVGIYIDLFGVVQVGRVLFDSCTETTNAYTEEHFRYDAEATSSNGFGTLQIGEVTFGRNCDYSQNVVIANGASSAALRRLRSLSIDSLVSYGQLQYALYILENGTAYGVENVNVGRMVVDGTNNSVFNSASTDSRTMRLACSETTDRLTFGHVSVINKYRVAITQNVNCSVGNFVFNDLKTIGITDYWTTDVPVVHMTGLGTPEGVVVANIGSSFNRCDGGAGTCGYRKESGTGGTGWAAK